MGCGGSISNGGAVCDSTKIVAKTVTHSNRYTRQLARKRRLKLSRPTINELRM